MVHGLKKKYNNFVRCLARTSERKVSSIFAVNFDILIKEVMEGSTFYGRFNVH